MKALKDIGQTTSVYRLDDPSYRIKFIGLGQLHIYSDAEIHEFAKRIWDAAVNSSGWIRDPNDIQMDVEDFLKIEGL